MLSIQPFIMSLVYEDIATQRDANEQACIRVSRTAPGHASTYICKTRARTHAYTQMHTGASSPSMPATPDAALIAKKQRRLVKNRSCISVCALSKYQICAWGAVDGKVQGQIDDKETASDTADEAGLCARGAKGLRRLLGFLCYL